MTNVSIEELHRVLNDECLVNAGLLIEYWQLRDPFIALELSLALDEAVDSDDVRQQLCRVCDVVQRYQPKAGVA